MKTDKSLEEVWKWKDKVYEETKSMSMEERVKKIKESAKKINEKYGLDLKKANEQKIEKT